MFENRFLNTVSVWKSGQFHSTINKAKRNLKPYQKYVTGNYDIIILIYQDSNPSSKTDNNCKEKTHPEKDKFNKNICRSQLKSSIKYNSV